jgi:hypothetical protein
MGMLRCGTTRGSALGGLPIGETTTDLVSTGAGATEAEGGKSSPPLRPQAARLNAAAIAPIKMKAETDR